MQQAIQEVAKPFAVFFAEAFDALKEHRLSNERRKKPVFIEERELPFPRCWECLHHREDCKCD